jgi:hypothetical protein
MSFLRRPFFIKLRSWEYWPFHVFHAPLYIYWLWLSVKARSLTFFSASNPGILMGGMFGESKAEVMSLVPESVKPQTLLIQDPTDRAQVLEQLRGAELNFPLIFKPDLGERGWRVRKILSEQDVDKYLDESNIPFLAQPYVDLPLEFGVFYVRYPSESSGRVISIVGKEMLSVTGDGIQTLEALILAKDRARLQWEQLHRSFSSRLNEVIPSGETVELVSIGNHCLGTKFLNSNHLITEKLNASFDAISKQIPGFFFGRYDLRTASEVDLEAGGVVVLELNGCGAEPAHIYQPGFSLWEGLRVLFQHWSDIYRVSHENHQRGTPYMGFQEARQVYRRFKSLTRS